MVVHRILGSDYRSRRKFRVDFDLKICYTNFVVSEKERLKIMSDREILLKQWRNLPTDNNVTWETFKRKQRPKIVRQSRPDDWKASRRSSVTHPRTFGN